jgi:hypothetical protein
MSNNVGGFWNYAQPMDVSRTLIKFGTGTTMISFGVSQILRPRGWMAFLPDWLKRVNPVDDLVMMRLHGGGNLILGLWLMMGVAPQLAVWVCLAWWLSILPFAIRYDWRDGLRDFTIIAGLAACLWLL